MYPNPEVFSPERHLSPSTASGEYPMDPRKYAFGVGRRECPGNEFALASLFVTVATIFATTNVRKAKDKSGNEITPERIFNRDSVTGRFANFQD
jgi:cytochrome P450